MPEQIARTSQDLIDEDAFFAFLEQRRGLLDGVVICGGEPTLQADLETFIREVKARNYKVKLDTNGFLPNVLGRILEQQLVDYVAVDVKMSFGHMHELIQQRLPLKYLRASFKLLQSAGIPYEYRTTLIKWWHTQENMQALLEEIAWAPRYVLQNYFAAGKTVDPEFVGWSFTSGEMNAFADLACRYVQTCVVRT